MIKYSNTKGYNLKWQIKFAPNYKVSICGKVFNLKTGKELKRTINGGYSVGYWINSKFFTLKKLRNNLEIIKEIELPF